MKGKTKIILIIAIILLAAVGGYYLSQKYFQEGAEEGTEEVRGFGSQLYDSTKGLMERIPETNPFKRVKLNPFE